MYNVFIWQYPTIFIENYFCHRIKKMLKVIESFYYIILISLPFWVYISQIWLCFSHFWEQIQICECDEWGGAESRGNRASLIIINSLLHRPRSTPTALGPAPLVTVRYTFFLIFIRKKIPVKISQNTNLYLVIVSTFLRTTGLNLATDFFSEFLSLHLTILFFLKVNTDFLSNK